MATNQILLSGTITDMAGPLNIQPLAVTGATTPFGITTSVSIVSGPNTVTVPSSARFVLLIPVSVTSSPFTLKGITGDSGVNISASQPTMLSFDSNVPASFVLTSSTTAGSVLVTFG